MPRRHRCEKMGNGTSWMTCCVCRGRLHMGGCTSRRDPAKDCCLARHQRLHDSGQTVGLDDESLPMLGTNA